jgi:hypothetical protein
MGNLKKIFPVIIFTVLASISSAFAQYWANTYGGEGDEVANSVLKAPNGGYIVAGETTSSGAGNSDAWIMKLDINGAIAWQKTYGGPASDSAQIIQQTKNGSTIGYIVAGHTDYLGSKDIRIMKLNEAGTILWQKIYGSPAVVDSVHAIEQTVDGGYVVTGNTSGNEGDYLIIKLDGEGNITWQKRYGGTDVDTLTSYCKANDGGYIMAGDSWSFGGNRDFWIVKVDENGLIVWQKRVGLREFVPEASWNNNIENSPSIQSIAGGYIVAGRSDPSLGPNPLLWMFKLDDSGNITWQRFYALLKGLNVSSIIQTADLGYILTGHADSTESAVGHDWILKLDVNGIKLWGNEYYRWDYQHLDKINSLIPAANGGYMVAGATSTWTDSWELAGDAWLLKLDANGLIADCSAISPFAMSLIPEEVEEYAHDDTSVADTDVSLAISSPAVEVYDSAAIIDDGCSRPSIFNLVSLPRTGQTTSYHPGDDGDIRAGVSWPTPRFTDHEDGTVTDRLTGLMWLKDANCADTIGYNPDSSTHGRMQWTSALDFVAAINAGDHNACSGGYNDWRLANINELGSLANLGQSDLWAWLIAQSFENVESSYGNYWSSTTHIYHTNGALQVMMSDGGYTWNSKTNHHYVWPVRSGQQDYPDLTFPANVCKTGQTENYHQGDDGDYQYGIAWPVSVPHRFTDNRNGTVTDNLTGLIWLKDAGCFGAADYETTYGTIADFNDNPGGYDCTEYSASYDDWRLSNRTELLSLIDRSQATPPLPPGHPFVNINSGAYRSASTYADPVHTHNEWQVDMFYYGLPTYSSKGTKPFWPVRGGIILCECDLNDDGRCDGLDWLNFYPDWGRDDCNDPGLEPCECDLNGDGSCDGKDWLLFYPEWGRTNCSIP